MSTAVPLPSINDPMTWKPNVPPPILALENMAFAGNCLASVFYGMTVVLFFQCLGALFSGPSPIKRILLGYVFFTFTLGTLFTAFNLRIFQYSYVSNRNFPGSPAFPPGPQGYLFFNYSQWPVILPNACFIVTNWMADGLLMFRCSILYGRLRIVLILPILMYMASFTFGIITIYKTSRPDSSLWSGISFDFALPYFVISVSLNILLTLLMAGRLILHLSQIKKLGSAPKGGKYGDVITILVESCALYAVTSVLFIGTYGAGHNASTIFLPILSQAQIIAPFLIILRVATNRAIEDTTKASSRISGPGIVFASSRVAPTDSMSNGDTTKLSRGGSDKFIEMDIQPFSNGYRGTTTV